MLGVFQKLLASRAHFHEAIYILNSLFEFLPLAALQPFLPTIWGLLFQKCVLCRKLCFQAAEEPDSACTVSPNSWAKKYVLLPTKI